MVSMFVSIKASHKHPFHLPKLSGFTELLVFEKTSDQNGPFWDDHQIVK